MSFQPVEFLDLAKELINEQPANPVTQEVICRSSISRAYYAAFLQARTFLYNYTNIPLQFKGEDHKLVRDTFLGNVTDGKWRRIGNSLKFLLEKRTFADYNDPITNVLQLARICLLRADEVLIGITELEQRTKP